MPKGVPGSKAPHGTWARYCRHGCRCDECREAQTLYARKRSGRKSRAEWLAGLVAARVHGSVAEYGRGCRCDECRAASNEARRLYRAEHREAEAARDREYRRKRREAA